MGPHYDLVDRNLDGNGDLTLNGFTTPYFDENFLRGDNALGITLGNVYNNVRFPFNLNGDGYWEYDSVQDNGTLKQDPDGTYFIQKTDPFHINPFGEKGGSYMPFHEATGTFGTTDGYASQSNINYMFGQRLDLTFTVPEGGRVNMPGTDGTEQMEDVIFQFEGDDDCWIFIDGQLVLDMGGIHDAVRGILNFQSGEWYVYQDLDGAQTIPENGKGSFKLVGDENTVHTLTMFYMERGLGASNLKIVFNFPQQNTLRVTKEVDTSSVDEIFDEAIANLGGFEMQMETMVTSGTSLPVEKSAGYIQTDSVELYDPEQNVTGNYTGPTGDGAAAEEDTDNDTQEKYLVITQPEGWDAAGPPGSTDTDAWQNYLLTLTPTGGSIDLNHGGDPLAFLELELYNGTTDNRGAELYIQLQDSAGNLVTGTARTLSYLGEANLFLPNTKSMVRIDLDSLIASNSKFDEEKVTAVRIGLLNGTGDGGTYRLYRASFGTEWNKVLSTGFSVGDDQISDYGSIVKDGIGKETIHVFSPVDGAWYTRQTHDEGGNVIESISNVVQDGSFSLSDGQTAVFTDKFRVGSYIRLWENVDPKLFETTWSIREDGEPVSFNSLLQDRFDAPSVINPGWGFNKGETPLENQPGTIPDDGREESSVSEQVGITYDEKVDGFIYRGYLYPDNNENLPIDLEVIFYNRMLTGEFTITKQLDDSMGVPQSDETTRYPVGTYTFDVYYTDIAGRGLEQYLPEQPAVEGVGTRYVHQVIEITTDEANGRGSYTMEGIPAGTKYLIRERPANGATLVNLVVENNIQSAASVENIVKNGTEPDDYTKAYVEGKIVATDNTGATETTGPECVFTNKNEPFFMEIQKVWDDEPPTDLKEIQIMVQRREAGSKDETKWEPVTQDYFNVTTDYVTLTPGEDDSWSTASKTAVLIYPTQGTQENNTVLYEYRIVEIGVGQDKLAGYRVVYDQIAGEPQDGQPVVIYRARNSKTGLTLQKTWLDNENRDKTRPSAVRVQLQRSTDYNPDDPNAEGVTWEVLDENGDPVSSAFITLQTPTWSYQLEGLPVSDANNNPYYYRLQEVQVQDDETGAWVDIAKQNNYEPAYSQPVTLDETAVITVENALRTAAIQVTKIDALNSDKTLPGAVFQLDRLIQASDGSWVVDTNWGPLTGTTGEGGILTFQSLRPGRYRLTETKAPDGYVKSFEPTDVTLRADHLGQTFKVTVTNSTPQTFTFTKVAAEDNNKPLSGAEFHLYPLVCGDTSHTHDEILDTENPGSCWDAGSINPETSGADGVVMFENLPPGLYRLVETKAPGGYALPTGQWNVTLTANGGVTITAVGGEASVPAFVLETTGGTTSYKLPNRKPMDMPSSGGPGVPLAAALGTLMMGGGVCLAATRLRPRRKKRKPNPQK